MLLALSIRDIVVIDRLSIDLRAGLTAFTGETGAGKSILLDSLSLALGARGDASLVRAGAEQGDVTAVFDVTADHPARLLLRERELNDDGDLILRRVQSSDGRSRAFVNDEPVSVGLLRDLGARLVEIHGQHDERAMIDPAAYRRLLDAYGKLAGDVDAVGNAFRAWRRCQDDLAALRERMAAAQADAEYLRASVEELTALDPRDGEEEELAELRQRMMQAEKVAGDIAEAHDIVAGSGSPMPTLASLARRLERKSPEAGELLTPTIEALDRALTALQEAEGALAEASAAAEHDPDALERAEERLFALRAASRKYNVPVSDLAALAGKMATDLAALDAGEDQLADLEQATVAAREAYGTCAARLSARRATAARKLAKSVTAELPDLKLERAAFEAKVASDPERVSETGSDTVSFLVRTNPGSEPGPLMKVASGGELARFMLALKVALADKGSAPTLVFDEVDTAVGGAVADAIGARLERLAGKVQVLSVTHAPQVAARAASHLLVSKKTTKRGQGVATGVVALDESARREEIARMLAGATVTDEARAAADRLILGAA